MISSWFDECFEWKTCRRDGLPHPFALFPQGERTPCHILSCPTTPSHTLLRESARRSRIRQQVENEGIDGEISSVSERNDILQAQLDRLLQAGDLLQVWGIRGKEDREYFSPGFSGCEGILTLFDFTDAQFTCNITLIYTHHSFTSQDVHIFTHITLMYSYKITCTSAPSYAPRCPPLPPPQPYSLCSPTTKSSRRASQFSRAAEEE